jgi:group I intron endonuclease
MYIVYKHTNLHNGKVYIGITSTDVKKRWGNGSGYLKTPVFWNAIQKYGWNSFSHEILFDNLSQEEAEQKEIELIALYKSNHRDFGYNVQNGGSTSGKHSLETRMKISESNKGKSLSPEARERISNTLKGRKMPLEVRQKISDSLKGEKSYWYGKESPNKGRKATPEEIQRKSEAHKGKILSEETKHKISESLKGEKSVWYGRKHTQESIEKMKASATNKRKVRCVETGIVYESIHDAGGTNNINFRNIHTVCTGGRNTAGGFHWEFVG